MPDTAEKKSRISVRLTGEDQDRLDRLRTSLSPARPGLIDVSDVIRYALELACRHKFGDD